MSNKRTAAALMLGGLLFAGEALFAQNLGAQNAQPVSGRDNGASIDQEIAMLRSDLRSTRKQVVAANMKLTDTEAEKFLLESGAGEKCHAAEAAGVNVTKFTAVVEKEDNVSVLSVRFRGGSGHEGASHT